MPPEITRLTQEFLSNPVRIEAAAPATTAETVAQCVFKFRPSRKDAADREKREALRALLKAEGDALKNAIVFCNRKRDVSVVFKSLEKHGFNVGALHGDLDQSVRMRVLDGFRDGAIQVLVASDVAARGLDIPSVSHVFNYDVPIHADDYVHRIGRTGRAGRSGKAVMLCLPADEKHLEKIEALTTKPIPEIEAPEGFRAPQPSESAEAEPAPKTRRRRAKPDAESARPTEQGPEPRVEPRTESRPAQRADDEAGRNRRGGRRRGREDDRSGPPIVGLGDHVPAFLLREVTLPKRSSRKADHESDTSETAEEAA
jgi:superfamily II DNA/RNA helicase